MAQYFSYLRALAIASILLLSPGTNLLSQAVDPGHVLILNTYDGSSAPYDRPTEIFRAELQRQFGEPISFSEFSLDAREPEFKLREELLAELLRNRFVDTPPDIVFAIGPPAIRFWIEHRDTIAARASLIALTIDGIFSPEDLRRGDVARLTRFSFSDTVDEILRLRPATSHVVIVLGSTPRARAAAAQARKELVAYSERLKFEYTNDMTLQELQARLGELSEESAVYFGVINVDAAGVILPLDQGLSIVRSASRTPIFGMFDDQIGMGIVGGRLIQLRKIGLDAAASAAAILRGEPVLDAWTVTDLSTPVYDWRELDKWNIDTDRLPAASEIRYKPPTLWEQYAAWIVLVTTVVAIQSLLIVALVTQRRRRAAAELAKAKLGGQLINAYEDQHRAIARELHDDLSQRLAR
ncbi:MAG: hypothetical protein JSW21_05040, partial [Gammaproteobacteria bacterium]